MNLMIEFCWEKVDDALKVKVYSDAKISPKLFPKAISEIIYFMDPLMDLIDIGMLG